MSRSKVKSNGGLGITNTQHRGGLGREAVILVGLKELTRKELGWNWSSHIYCFGIKLTGLTWLQLDLSCSTQDLWFSSGMWELWGCAPKTWRRDLAPQNSILKLNFLHYSRVQLLTTRESSKQPHIQHGIIWTYFSTRNMKVMDSEKGNKAIYSDNHCQ